MSDNARLLLPLVFAAVVLHAQGTGEITGTITDPSSAAVSGARIAAINTATSAERIITSNDTGNYDLPALAPGVYDLKVEFPGFRAAERKGVEIQVGAIQRLDFTL